MAASYQRDRKAALTGIRNHLRGHRQCRLTAFTESWVARASVTASESTPSARTNRDRTLVGLASKKRKRGLVILSGGRNFHLGTRGPHRRPAEIASMGFLASPKSNHTSGAVITLDAGVSSRGGSF